MPKPKNNPTSQTETGTRLSRFVTSELRITIPDLSKKLGYASPDTLRKVLAGSCYLSPDKMIRLAQVSDELDSPLDLDWLLTGRGYSTVDKSTKATNEDVEDLLLRLQSLPSTQRRSVIKLAREILNIIEGSNG